MAKCPECGQRAAFGTGRAVVPALSSVNEILSHLREDQADGDSSVASMISEGERHKRDLHTAAHNMSAIRISWPTIQGWIDRAARRNWEKIQKMQKP